MSIPHVRFWGYIIDYLCVSFGEHGCVTVTNCVCLRPCEWLLSVQHGKQQKAWFQSVTSCSDLLGNKWKWTDCTRIRWENMLATGDGDSRVGWRVGRWVEAQNKGGGLRMTESRSRGWQCARGLQWGCWDERGCTLLNVGIITLNCINSSLFRFHS